MCNRFTYYITPHYSIGIYYENVRSLEPRRGHWRELHFLGNNVYITKEQAPKQPEKSYTKGNHRKPVYPGLIYPFNIRLLKLEEIRVVRSSHRNGQFTLWHK